MIKCEILEYSVIVITGEHCRCRYRKEMVGGPVPGVFDTTRLCHRVVIKDATFLNLTLFVYYIVVYPQRFFLFLLLFFREIDKLVDRERVRDRVRD